MSSKHMPCITKHALQPDPGEPFEDQTPLSDYYCCWYNHYSNAVVIIIIIM
jgi:hypothetical protein